MNELMDKAAWMTTAGELDNDGREDESDVVVEDNEPSSRRKRRLVGGSGGSSLDKRSEC